MFEKRYHRLFKSAKDGILILNAGNGMIVHVNPYLIKMLGYTKEQFLKKTFGISALSKILIIQSNCIKNYRIKIISAMKIYPWKPPAEIKYT